MIYDIILLICYITLWLWLSHVWCHIVFSLLSLKIRKEIKRDKKVEVKNEKDSNQRRETKRDKSTVFDSDSKNLILKIN